MLKKIYFLFTLLLASSSFGMYFGPLEEMEHIIPPEARGKFYAYRVPREFYNFMGEDRLVRHLKADLLFPALQEIEAARNEAQAAATKKRRIELEIHTADSTPTMTTDEACCQSLEKAKKFPAAPARGLTGKIHHKK